MTRTVTSAVDASIAAGVSTAGYLVEIGFAATYRGSTRGNVTWRGYIYAGADIVVRGIGSEARNGARPALVIGNADLAIGALVLGEGVSARWVKVWQLYGEAPADLDPIEVFSGSVEAPTLAGDGSSVTLTLSPAAGGSTLYVPRDYMSVESGYANLTPPGTVIKWRGEKYRLEAEGG